MAVFTDTVTVYKKISETEWNRLVVNGVQWADKIERENENGKVSITKYVQITFPWKTCLQELLDGFGEEDCIVYGTVNDTVSGEKGSRIFDLLKKYPKSGLVQSVNDNSNRDFLKSIKVVIA